MFWESRASIWYKKPFYLVQFVKPSSWPVLMAGGGRKNVSGRGCGINEVFRNSYPTVSWKDLVWFSNAIPKHSFILWLAIRNRLLTQDRVQFWDNMGDVGVLFAMAKETR